MQGLDQDDFLDAVAVEQLLLQGWKSHQGDDSRFESFYYTNPNSKASETHKASWSALVAKYQARMPTGAMRDCGEVPTSVLSRDGNAFSVSFSKVSLRL